jgi:hypothetical protein
MNFKRIFLLIIMSFILISTCSCEEEQEKSELLIFLERFQNKNQGKLFDDGWYEHEKIYTAYNTDGGIQYSFEQKFQGFLSIGSHSVIGESNAFIYEKNEITYALDGSLQKKQLYMHLYDNLYYSSLKDLTKEEIILETKGSNEAKIASISLDFSTDIYYPYYINSRVENIPTYDVLLLDDYLLITEIKNMSGYTIKTQTELYFYSNFNLDIKEVTTMIQVTYDETSPSFNPEENLNYISYSTFKKALKIDNNVPSEYDKKETFEMFSDGKIKLYL